MKQAFSKWTRSLAESHLQLPLPLRLLGSRSLAGVPLVVGGPARFLALVLDQADADLIDGVEAGKKRAQVGS
jgi:hypothetical protein